MLASNVSQQTVPLKAIIRDPRRSVEGINIIARKIYEDTDYTSVNL